MGVGLGLGWDALRRTPLLGPSPLEHQAFKALLSPTGTHVLRPLSPSPTLARLFPPFQATVLALILPVAGGPCLSSGPSCNITSPGTPSQCHFCPQQLTELRTPQPSGRHLEGVSWVCFYPMVWTQESPTLTSGSTHASLTATGFCRLPLPHHALGQRPWDSAPPWFYGSHGPVSLSSSPAHSNGSQTFCVSSVQQGGDSGGPGTKGSQGGLRMEGASSVQGTQGVLHSLPYHPAPTWPIPSPTIPLPLCCPGCHPSITDACSRPFPTTGHLSHTCPQGPIS